MKTLAFPTNWYHIRNATVPYTQAHIGTYLYWEFILLFFRLIIVIKDSEMISREHHLLWNDIQSKRPIKLFYFKYMYIFVCGMRAFVCVYKLVIALTQDKNNVGYV